jgi:hypothetical protein
MDNKDEKFAVDALVEHYRKTKKSLDPKSIFEEYELIFEETRKSASNKISNNTKVD